MPVGTQDSPDSCPFGHRSLLAARGSEYTPAYVRESIAEDALLDPEQTTVADAHRKFIDEDLRLSPRSRRTYDYSLRTFLEHVQRDFGVDPAKAPVTDLTIEH